MNTQTQHALSREIDAGFLRRILAPYRPTSTDYLRSARIIEPQAPGMPSVISMEGDFSIPSSCYIQATGHFNAVEFLICFNQLAYTACAEVFRSRTFLDSGSPVSEPVRKQLERIDLDQYFDHQLSSMLIVKTSTRFRSPIHAEAFRGRLSISKIQYRRQVFFTETHCEFTDAYGGAADGDVLLAYATRMGERSAA